MTRRIQHLILAWLVLAVAVMITVWLFPGLEVDWSPGMHGGSVVISLVRAALMFVIDRRR